MHKVSYTTTIAAARATCQALRELDSGSVSCLQDLHRELHA
jgi:carbamoyl-phosphate synthase large subunit